MAPMNELLLQVIFRVYVDIARLCTMADSTRLGGEDWLKLDWFYWSCCYWWDYPTAQKPMVLKRSQPLICLMRGAGQN